MLGEFISVAAVRVLRLRTIWSCRGEELIVDVRKEIQSAKLMTKLALDML
jgi:hypothetical protein